jgi:hypothetical protein
VLCSRPGSAVFDACHVDGSRWCASSMTIQCGAAAQLEQVRQQRLQERRPLVERQVHQADDDVLGGPLDGLRRLVGQRALVGAAQRDRVRKLVVVPFRIEHEELILALGQLLEDGRRHGGLARARWPRDEQDAVVGRQPEVGARHRMAEDDVMPRQARRQLRQIGRDHPVDQLGDAGAVIGRRDEIHARLDAVERVGDRDGALARRQEGMVVLGVADADDVVRRQMEVRERALEAGGLVHARRQHHDGALVEDHLELEAEVADGGEHRRVVGGRPPPGPRGGGR